MVATVVAMVPAQDGRRRLCGNLIVAGLTGFLALRFTGHHGLYSAGLAGPVRATHTPMNSQNSLNGPLFESTSGETGGVLGIPSPAPDNGLSGMGSGSRGPVGVSVQTTKIVKRGSLFIEVPKGQIDRSIQRATDIASRYGGFVQSTSSYGAESGDVVLRVPVTKFERAVGALAAIGHVSSRNITGTDVTAKFVDLKGRLQIARQQRLVLLKLLSKASTISETLQVQNALAASELTIEQLEGQIRLLTNQAAQSTIQVHFGVPGAKAVTNAGNETGIKNPSFTRGLRHAVAGFLEIMVAVLVGLGYLIPIALLGLLVWLIVRRMRRPTAA
jgi:hypothetical protein